MTKELKVGLFTAISGAILYFGFNFLKGVNFFSNTQQFYAIYENIDGLNVSNPVIVNGFAVGRVSGIEILQNQNNKIIVEIDIKGNLTVGKGSSAVLMNSDFLGSKSILLDIKNIAQPLESGDTIQGEVDLGLAAILNSAEPITEDIGVMISNLSEVMAGMKGTGEQIKSTLRNLDVTVSNVNTLVVENNNHLRRTFDNLNGLLKNVDTKISQLGPLMSSADSTLNKINRLELEKAVNSLNMTLSQLETTVTDLNNGKGSLGKLLNEDSLYTNLNQAILDLDELLIHFDDNPKHFLGPLGQSSKKIARDREKSSE
ncbi:MlaD family protein [Reichenbachiella agariperforans]|uniref:Phospholipid/cholesterol/gamma-HCH transport system substrate-binding protein n=1 Tax=Reichenbachiella agariperforans TaxID=156994 RepID=A0A1M6LF92_REIAG|nr:MlaD family protein [Reichenbachiella agariperforans]MBU2913903.1 MCE family protein [Reichenbachiella agariperforans]SHJ69864.1 phospholipid/cholesterol/gamma-HCH transport system substrate-binding protein [Reichenbachiella agariperforans]